MFTITTEDRTYYCHRPAGCSTVLIERDGWPGQEFGLWLPETIFLEGEAIWRNWDESGRRQSWERDRDGALRWTFSAPRFTLVSTLWEDPALPVLHYKHAFTNTGDRPLAGASTQTCFHLVNAPRFISIRGERYRACLDGKWVTTNQASRHLSPDPHRVKFLKAGQRAERTVLPNFNFPSATLPETAHHPLFIAESLDGHAAVGIACRNFAEIFNNNDYILRCLHSEPQPLAPILPGGTVAQEAMLLFCDGNHRALIELFEEFVR